MNPIKISAAVLRVADIIVSTTNAAVSGVIRAGSGSDYSHTLLYIGNSQVIEAIAAGVVQRPVSIALSYATLAVVLRRRNLTSEQSSAVVTHARSFVGRPYSTASAVMDAGAVHNRALLISPAAALSARLRSSLPRSAAEDEAFFCSELVVRSFALAGAPVVNTNPTFVSPRAVRVAESLLYIGHLKGLA